MYSELLERFQELPGVQRVSSEGVERAVTSVGVCLLSERRYERGHPYPLPYPLPTTYPLPPRPYPSYHIPYPLSLIDPLPPHPYPRTPQYEVRVRNLGDLIGKEFKFKNNLSRRFWPL